MQMATARLAELEHGSAIPTSPLVGSVMCPGVLELWAWPLDRPLDTNLPLQRPALSLARVCTESAAVLLGAAWCSQPSEVKSAFIPLAMVASEKEAMLVLLGRLLAVLGAEYGACRLIIPVLTENLAARGEEVDAGVYAVAAHVLASIAGVCASSGNSWGFTQVVDILIKLYKFPQFSISMALLHGTPVLQNGAQPEANGGQAILPGTPAPKQQHIRKFNGTSLWERCSLS